MASELRVNTRTPALKLDAAFMLQASELPDALAGKLLRWGMDSYQDKAPLFSEWLDLHQNDQEIIEQFLDLNELKARRLIVIAFKQAALKAREISVSRAYARAQRGDVPDLNETLDTTTKAKAISNSSPDPHGHISQLNEIGMTSDEAIINQARWIEEYSVDEISRAIARINGRQIDRPGPYLDKILKNGRKQMNETSPEFGDGKRTKPKAVRRRTQVAPGSRWELMGWTCQGHPRDGGTSDTRKQVWRTDSGQLNYMPAENPSTNPSYNEDHGVYETE